MSRESMLTTRRQGVGAGVLCPACESSRPGTTTDDMENLHNAPELKFKCGSVMSFVNGRPKLTASTLCVNRARSLRRN